MSQPRRPIHNDPDFQRNSYMNRVKKEKAEYARKREKENENE